MAKDLSILIPSRNEMFLVKTIENILENIEADTEIIAVLDGAWSDPVIPQHERVNVVYVPESVGQRGAGDLAARLAKGKYVMKCDAHCAFDKGFDRKMIEFFQKVGDNVTAVPIMKNLHAFDWKCMTCGKKTYQGPTPTKCQEVNYKGTGQPCTGTKFKRKIIFQPRKGVNSTAYCFDNEPHFQYFKDYKLRPEYIEGKKEGVTETMSLQGSCYMSTLENYWKWDLGGESLGNWGNQGMQVACATWLSGGRVLVNHNTWYAHMFRTQGGDFGFPWQADGNDMKKTKENVKSLFYDRKHPTQIHPVSWLLEKFWPVPGWSEEDLKRLKEQEK